MLWQQLQEPVVELGWSFYGPVLLFVLLIALGRSGLGRHWRQCNGYAFDLRSPAALAHR